MRTFAKILRLPDWAPRAWGNTLRELNLSKNSLGLDRAGGGGAGLDVLAGLRSLTALTVQVS